MTALLEKAFEKIAQLPLPQQDQIASTLLHELVRLKKVTPLDTVRTPYRYRHAWQNITLEFALDAHDIPILLNLSVR